MMSPPNECFRAQGKRLADYGQLLAHFNLVHYVGLPRRATKTDMEHATLRKVADHIRHIGGLVGVEHVGLGSDFDGIPTVPRSLEDASKFRDLIAQLLRRDVSHEDAAKVAERNLLRVRKQLDEVILQVQAEGALLVEGNIGLPSTLLMTVTGSFSSVISKPAYQTMYGVTVSVYAA